LQHNAQRARWDRLKEKNPRLAAKIEAKASGLSLGEEAEEDSEESSSDDEEEVSSAVHSIKALDLTSFAWKCGA